MIQGFADADHGVQPVVFEIVVPSVAGQVDAGRWTEEAATTEMTVTLFILETSVSHRFSLP